MAKQENNTPATEAPAEVAAAPKTLDEQIAIVQARLNKLLAKKNSVAILESVKAGDEATFNYGRGEKVRKLTGTISAVGDRTDERGRVSRLAVVSVGEGLDTEQFRIRVQDILTLNGEGFDPGATDNDDDNDDADAGTAGEAPGDVNAEVNTTKEIELADDGSVQEADAGEDPFAS